MKTTIDRRTGKRFDYEPRITPTFNGLRTVGRWDTALQRHVHLHPSRLPPELFAELNPGKIQEDCL